ncbi:hypothetical protein PIB30_089970 [Stylosanthes scabra]|uniref:Alpha-N-acetylglucosaminidase C-terminal domain-containing protein n=1 Tax=Stylosanthes scabra TaxID=79078 RepID=A0ABU6XWK8_9FABA|nr:hypothetical protein [Stylosanthes scabra]
MVPMYDIVDLTRQVLAKYANQLFLEIIEAYQSGGLNQVTVLSQKFMNLVNDLDTLLASHDGFLLGPWLESAKQLAQNQEEMKQYEWNARTQITMCTNIFPLKSRGDALNTSRWLFNEYLRTSVFIA